MQTMAAAAAAGATEGAHPQPRLTRAAHEFEAQMMKELLKPMSGEASLTGDDAEAASGGALGEFASEALGKALSEQGGFGIANRIVHDLSPSGNRNVTGKTHDDTVIRALK